MRKKSHALRSFSLEAGPLAWRRDCENIGAVPFKEDEEASDTLSSILSFFRSRPLLGLL